MSSTSSSSTDCSTGDRRQLHQQQLQHLHRQQHVVHPQTASHSISVERTGHQVRIPFVYVCMGRGRGGEMCLCECECVCIF
jgi:hypothetical protein